jgi:hypothetical protein
MDKQWEQLGQLPFEIAEQARQERGMSKEQWTAYLQTRRPQVIKELEAVGLHSFDDVPTELLIHMASSVEMYTEEKGITKEQLKAETEQEVYDQIRKEDAAKIVAKMEAALADNIRILEEGWRSDDRAADAMDMLDELFDTPQPRHVLERCLDICRSFNELEEGLIAPRYFILLNALIKDAIIQEQLQ